MTKGISCHVGLVSVDPHHYAAGWEGPLASPELDARSMQEIAVACGYEASLLLTRDATIENVTAAIRRAAAELGPGDTFFLSFSGHGGQVPTEVVVGVGAEEEEEDDGSDETWCLFDGQLIDDQLYELFTTFREGARVVIVSDSCNSGTVSRLIMPDATGALDAAAAARPTVVLREGEWRLTQAAASAFEGAFEAVDPRELRIRAMPPQVALATYEQNKKAYDDILLSAVPRTHERVKARVRLLGGALDGKAAIDGPLHGYFTRKLIAAWNNGQFAGNYDAFFEALKASMRVQLPSHFVYGPADDEFDAKRPFQL